MNIYVSNLGFGVQSEDLKKIFTPYGEVSSVNIIMDKVTNRSRGFGFVDMPDQQSAENAMRELEGKMLDGRAIKMNEARPREQR
ncbi:RNA-binding protein [Flavihumibacter sp. ZG627]|uniref:RNA recognition motif domain-containing protein n=1 Tax=Flavihumibacter sp. ZG627 TaxID=1463156 RepID=UPI000580B3B3|nr:RNA-binding protein [Flavihumibacter sp. ZG627]KIC90491.1 RNA-binding protein [Flavihumibacter sp. ZG627]